MTIKDLIYILLEYDVESEIWVDPSFYVDDEVVYEPFITTYNGKVYIN
jgi:hypothetical protein